MNIALKNAPRVTVGIFESSKKNLQSEINSIGDDLSKIIRFNISTRPNAKFVVIDKANSRAMLYQGEKQIESFDIGIGETIGDSLNDVSYDYVTKTFSKTGRTTPSGEFRTAKLPESCYNKNDYVTNGNINAILLNGVTHPATYRQNTAIALHQLPNNLYEERLSVLNSDLKRKSITTGCVNLRTDDFKRLATQIPEETTVYILPEEAGNSLQLTELPNGKMWFKTKYNDNERDNALDLAIKHYFHI